MNKQEVINKYGRDMAIAILNHPDYNEKTVGINDDSSIDYYENDVEDIFQLHFKDKIDKLKEELKNDRKTTTNN